MNFCIISPTAGLERYATLSKTHLVLAHIQNPKYISFYQKRRREGDFLILDNGAHEQGKAEWANVVVGLNRYNPQVCVLPDTLNDSIKTARDSLLFLDKYNHYYPNTEWMYVPQGMGWYRSTKRVLEDLRSGSRISWIGISRYLTINQGFSRIGAARAVKDIDCGFEVKLHALGMVKGSLKELEEIRTSDLFESCDSSVPVWRGWNSFSIDNPIWNGLSCPCDFSAPFPEEQVDKPWVTKIIKDNLEACGVDTSSLR